tara:strand:+ start:609 stop:1301 length:693 start_codon:yes stop_codon:yes gene_type:complete
MRFLRLLLLFGLVWAAPVRADFQAGVEAYKAGDYQTALAEWLPLAEAGNADAQFNVGLIHDGGQGVPRDYDKAVYWYRKAAEQGLAEAQYYLANMQIKGQGSKAPMTESCDWALKSAQGGYAPAQEAIALGYVHGDCGLPKDPWLAMEWAEKSAMQGDELGLVTVVEILLHLHRTRAWAWMRIAEDIGHPKAPKLRALLEDHLTQGQIRQGNRDYDKLKIEFQKNNQGKP